MKNFLKLLFGVSCCLISQLNYADEVTESSFFSPALATQVSWVFSGIVANENGDNYDYLFQMQREGLQFHATIVLFDAETKKIILQDDEVAMIEDPTTYNWHVGHAFLQFNPINASWIFGLKNQDKTGFNFKVDMLAQSEQDSLSHHSQQAVEFVVSQTGQLNGHIQLTKESSEQFVTAKNAWFRQIWLSALNGKAPVTESTKMHQLRGVLCRFDDGSGFYSMNRFESNIPKSSIAEWFDEKGASNAMSQFINVKQESDNGPWHIRIASPNLHFVLTDLVKQNAVVAGFVTEKDKQGFCMLSDDAISEVQQTVTKKESVMSHVG